MTNNEVHPIVWTGECITLLDQTLLPSEETYVDIQTVDALVDAISRLVVRGAPALGAVGAYGVALAMVQGEREDWSADELHENILRISNARPTAVNLAWGVDRVLPLVESGLAAVVADADADEVAVAVLFALFETTGRVGRSVLPSLPVNELKPRNAVRTSTSDNAAFEVFSASFAAFL